MALPCMYPLTAGYSLSSTTTTPSAFARRSTCAGSAAGLRTAPRFSIRPYAVSQEELLRTSIFPFHAGRRKYCKKRTSDVSRTFSSMSQSLPLVKLIKSLAQRGELREMKCVLVKYRWLFATKPEDITTSPVKADLCSDYLTNIQFTWLYIVIYNDSKSHLSFFYFPDILHNIFCILFPNNKAILDIQ